MPDIISIIAQEYVIIVCSLLNHIVIHYVIEFVLVILVDVDTRLTHLGAFLIMVHIVIPKRVVHRPFRIKLALLLIWNLIEVAWILIKSLWRRILVSRGTHLSSVELLRRWLDLIVLWLPGKLVLRGFILGPVLRLDLLKVGALELVWLPSFALLTLVFDGRSSLTWTHRHVHLVVPKGITWHGDLFDHLLVAAGHCQIAWRHMVLV